MSTTATKPRTRSASTASRTSRSRFRAVWAATLAGLLGLLFTALTAVTVVLWASDSSYTETNPVVDLAFLALGLIIAVGFASQVRGRHVAGLQQAILALLALAAAGWLGGRIEPLVGPLVLLAAAMPLVALHPDRRRLLAAGAGASKPLAALAVAAAVPVTVYAADMLDHARAAGPSCFLGQCAQGDRYAEAAALTIAMVAVALLAAARTPGWMLPAWSAGAAAVVFGGASLSLPGTISALSAVWAVAAVVWGCAVIAVAHAQRRSAAVPRRDNQVPPASGPLHQWPAGGQVGRGTPQLTEEP